MGRDEGRFVGAIPKSGGRVGPRMVSVPAPMPPPRAGRTVTASTADHRTWRSQMDAMTQLLLATAVLCVLKLAATQLR